MRLLMTPGTGPGRTRHRHRTLPHHPRHPHRPGRPRVIPIDCCHRWWLTRHNTRLDPHLPIATSRCTSCGLPVRVQLTPLEVTRLAAAGTPIDTPGARLQPAHAGRTWRWWFARALPTGPRTWWRAARLARRTDWDAELARLVSGEATR